MPRLGYLKLWSALVAATVLACSSESPSGEGTSTQASHASSATGDAATTSTATSSTSAGAGGRGGAGGSGGSGVDGTGGAGASGGGGSNAGGSGGSGGACDPSVGLIPPNAQPPESLSSTGLYADIAAGVIADGIEEFSPLHHLWSDGAAKRRFVYLPPCSSIDTSDMDHWSMPVGTRFWKEFTVDGTRVETRLIHRFGPGQDDFFFAAYQWNAELTEATLVPLGVQNANGTQHDIPSEASCKTCHGYLPEHILGFGAVQLSHAHSDVTIETLSSQGRLTVPAPEGFSIPGNPIESDALGYLHANCGHCHNSFGIRFLTPFDLRVSTMARTVNETGAYMTAVGVAVEKFVHPGVTQRIAPHDVDASCVHYRMSQRGTTEQMPPLATEVVDVDGIAIVDRWIEGLR